MHGVFTMNKVFIRGMLLYKYVYEDHVTVLVCSRSLNKTNENYQYVTFRDAELMKKVKDEIPSFTPVTVEARAFVPVSENGQEPGQVRLHGMNIMTTRQFIRENFSERGISPFGLQLKDCVRFSFSGFVASIASFNNQAVHITVKIPAGKRYNFIPCVKYLNPERETLDDVMSRYRKGDRISVNGWIRQKQIQEEGKRTEYQNRYVITSFLQSDVQYEFDAMKAHANTPKDIPAPENADVRNQTRSSNVMSEIKSEQTVIKKDPETAEAERKEKEEMIRANQERAKKEAEERRKKEEEKKQREHQEGPVSDRAENGQDRKQERPSAPGPEKPREETSAVNESTASEEEKRANVRNSILNIFKRN